MYLSLLVYYFILIGAGVSLGVAARSGTDTCDQFWDIESKPRGSPEQCAKFDEHSKFVNLPIVNGVYCYNNGTGLCKAFAGRFEFYFNSWTDEIIGPVEDGDHVKNGYHSRIPHSYNVEGNILFADRAINWAKAYSKASGKLNLLNLNQFNWCTYTNKDNWPYKTAIKDPLTNGRFHIYFSNRQSCIYDKNTGKRQHYNTRFVHRSDLRIDLDFNPLIFVMQDNIANNEFRMVKNKRQHWYEVKYKVLEKPKEGINYFIHIDIKDSPPCKINGTTSLFGANAYKKFTDLCISERIFRRQPGTGNSQLVQTACGLDEIEIADLTWFEYQKDSKGKLVYEAELHSLPRHPTIAESFFGVKFESDDDWIQFAKDGVAFSAATSIPIKSGDEFKTNSVRVIMLWSNYSINAEDPYDEHYPLPFLADYIAKYDGSNWKYDRVTNSKAVKNLNFVDDIAYLHKCETILIVFGPLYSELPENKFNLDERALVGSIDSLGAHEMINAFFAVPETNTLYFYHRLNHIAEHHYTCGAKDGSSLVTARRVGQYMARHGVNVPKIFSKLSTDVKYRHSEEQFFKYLGVFDGSLDNPEAPDPAKYPYVQDINIVEPPEPASYVWLYVLIALAIMIMLTMCIVCLSTIRRRKRRRRTAAQGATTDLGAPTARSSMAGMEDGSQIPSTRSALTKSSPLSRQGSGLNKTSRTNVGSRSGGGVKPEKSTSTVRSGLGGRKRGAGGVTSAGTERTLTRTQLSSAEGRSNKSPPPPRSGRHGTAASR